MQAGDFQISSLRSVSPVKAISVIMLLSAGVFVFLVWLIYFKPSPGYTSQVIAHLPAVNAILNAMSSIFLVLGFRAVLNKRYALHIKLMFFALVCSTLFLISYVAYHNFHGDTKFTGTGLIRPIYFFVLISHIALSALVVPMILTSLYLALAGKLAIHRRVSRYTFPVWLYVSVTGVIIFLMLKAFSG